MAYTTMFPDQPDTARLWIQGATHSVDAAVQERTLADLKPFFDDWTAHGHPVTGAARWRDNRFLFVAAHCKSPNASISGCAIDAFMSAVREITATHSIAWTPSLSVMYRGEGGAVTMCTRNDFAQRAENGTVDVTTSVFDSSLTQLSELRQGLFEQPASETWHARAFSLVQPA